MQGNSTLNVIRALSNHTGLEVRTRDTSRIRQNQMLFHCLWCEYEGSFTKISQLENYLYFELVNTVSVKFELTQFQCICYFLFKLKEINLGFFLGKCAHQFALMEIKHKNQKVKTCFSWAKKEFKTHAITFSQTDVIFSPINGNCQHTGFFKNRHRINRRLHTVQGAQISPLHEGRT